MTDPNVNKNGVITLFLLEMIIDTGEAVICEPVGVYSSFEMANKYLDQIHLMLSVASDKNVVLNILKFNLDEKPEMLKEKGLLKNVIGEQLYSLYTSNVFEQMVESDGSFSYQLTSKYKQLLEKIIGQQHSGEDGSNFNTEGE